MESATNTGINVCLIIAAIAAIILCLRYSLMTGVEKDIMVRKIARYAKWFSLPIVGAFGYLACRLFRGRS